MFRFILATLLAALPAMAQDTISTVDATDGTITIVQYDWTSDGSGDAAGVTSDPVPGVVFSVRFTPSGTAQPTNNYDVVVYESFADVDGGSDIVTSTDLLGGEGADRANTDNIVELVKIWPDAVTTVTGRPRIEISNAGATTQGRVELFIARNLRIQRGDASIPLTSGTSGQILQYKQAGQSKFVTMSGGATIADGGAVTLAGNPTFSNVFVGEDDTDNGAIFVFGDDTGSGGGIVLYKPADDDTTIDRVSIIGGDQNNAGRALLFDLATSSNDTYIDDGGDWYYPGAINADDVNATGVLNFDPLDATTISSGAITATATYMILDTEGAAASDDLDTISGGSDGDILFLRTMNNDRDVVIKNGTDNIVTDTGSDVTLTIRRNVIGLIYIIDKWRVFAPKI